MDQFVKHEPVDNPVESIKLFALCENLKWSHLPVDGGLYDQHPKLLDQWRYIFAKRNEYEAEQEKKREQERKRQSSSMRKPSRPSRSTRRR